MINDRFLFLILAVSSTMLIGVTTIEAARRDNNRFDVFSLIVPLGAWTVCVFDVVPILMVLFDLADNSVLEQWIEVICWVDAGFVGFVFTYRTALRPRPVLLKTKLAEDWNSDRTLVVVAVLWVLGLVGNYLFYSAVGGVEYYTQHLAERVSSWGKGLGPIHTMRSAGSIALIMWVAYMMHASHGRVIGPFVKRSVTLVLLLSSLVPTIPMGSRTGVLSVFVDSLIVYHLLKRRLPLAKIALFLLVAITFSYVYGEARLWVGKEHSASTLNVMGDGLADRGLRPVLRDYEQYIEVCARIFEGVPHEVEYQLGRTYVSGFLYVIPRNIWTEKPDVNAAVLLSDTLYAGTWNGLSYVTPSLWGEAFMNFGFIGMIVVPVVFGGVSGVFERRLRQTPVSPAHAALYVLVFRWVDGLAIGDFVNVNRTMLAEGALMLAACYFVIRRPERVSHSISQQIWSPRDAVGGRRAF